MNYALVMKPSFLSDLVALPADVRRRAAQATERLEEAPETAGGNIKALARHRGCWRYRIGDYRLIYAVRGTAVQLLGVGHRRDIYARFDAAPALDDEWDPDLALEPIAATIESTPEPSSLSPTLPASSARALPVALTPELLRQWLVPEDYHPALLACKTEEELLACDAPPKVLERVLECLWPRPIAQILEQPDLLVGGAEALGEYLDGSLRHFLLRLDPDQERFVDWALRGPTLVKGGPGTGKSTVALYRVRELLRRAPLAPPRILFTTFTNALVECSRQLLESLLGPDLGHVTVSTVDKVAVGILAACGEHPQLLRSDQVNGRVQRARDRVVATAASPEERLAARALEALRPDYLVEEFDWVIEGRNLRTIDEYLEAERAGRGYRFGRAVREAVWHVYTEFRADLAREGWATWGDVRTRAREMAQAGRWTQQWDYVLVDEAQDLRPNALALCLEVARSPQGVFLTADANQSLYNRGFRWQDVHDSLRFRGRTAVLKKNYRSTRQLAEAVADIAFELGDRDVETLAQETVYVGSQPALGLRRGHAAQLDWLVATLHRMALGQRAPLSAAAVLAPSNRVAQELERELRARGLEARFMTGAHLDLDAPVVKLLTLHSAKGLEFPIVAIPFVEDGLLPRSLGAAPSEDMEEHLAAERRLLFVGCTRAMRALILTADPERRSPFLDALSPERWTIDAEELGERSPAP